MVAVPCFIGPINIFVFFIFNTCIGIILILLRNAFHYVPKKKEEKKMTTKKLYTSEWYTLGISGEIFMISRFLKVDVVLGDLIALGKELKIVTTFNYIIKSLKLLYFALNYL